MMLTIWNYLKTQPHTHAPFHYKKQIFGIPFLAIAFSIGLGLPLMQSLKPLILTWEIMRIETLIEKYSIYVLFFL